MIDKIKGIFGNTEVNPFIRIAMIFVAGFLVSLGLLPPDQTFQFVELAGGILTGGVALIWYVYSEARDALKERIARRKAEKAAEENEPSIVTDAE